MAFQISEFQSTINTYIPQRSNLFTMTIEGGPASALASGNSDTTIAWLCTATTFPGVTITPIEKPFFGRNMKFPGEMVFADWSTTIINDNGFAVRNVIEKWMAMMNTHQTNVREFGQKVGTEFATAHIQGYDQNGQVGGTSQINFKGIWPTSLSPITLNYDTTGDIEQFDVGWAYQYWTVESIAGGVN